MTRSIVLVLLVLGGLSVALSPREQALFGCWGDVCYQGQGKDAAAFADLASRRAAAAYVNGIMGEMAKLTSAQCPARSLLGGWQPVAK